MISAALVLLLSLGVVSAHNWVASPSRSFRASTVRPALSRRSEKPHVQVTKGQVRAHQWVTVQLVAN